MARCCAALEVLDDDHAAAAAWTAIDRWLVNIGGISTGGLILWHREQLASASDVVGTRGFGEQAVMADAVEAFGSTWMRKRRMNSSMARVIALYRADPLLR